MTARDTIAAISSAVGSAARMIVRASGPEALRIASALWTDRFPDAATASSGTLCFSDLEVPATLYVFHSPRSYTGEDLVEFHIPGNPLLARMLLDALIRGGCRSADAGEFTARAYFNGRIDLTEAEGVAATIAAGSEQELRAARQLLAGELTRRLRPASDLIVETLALVEVGIDFSDEDVTFLSASEVRERLVRAHRMLTDLLDGSSRFDRLSHEPRIVLVGRPNAGKSTLLNALAGHDRAVTSPIAGTTRDVLSADVALRRGIVKLTDAAGIDAVTSDSEDIQRQMHASALRAIELADVVVMVREVHDEQPDVALPRPVDLVVHSKADLLFAHGPDPLFVSAKTGENMSWLRDTLDALAFGETGAGGAALALNARHVRALTDARDAVAHGAQRIDGGSAELVAFELREALDFIGQVVGLITPDDVLDRVFSAFCIGK